MTLTRIKKYGIIGGCLFIFSTLLITAIFPAIVKSQIKRNIALKQGWKMRDIWGKLPIPFDFRFYMFNVTNPDEIANGEKPRLQEVGPFIYEEWVEKTNQIDHEEDDTVSSTLRRTYIFDRAKNTDLTGDEELTVPNYFALGTINAVLKENPSALPIVGKAFESIMKKPTSLFIKAKVKDILFEGLPLDCNVSDFAGSAVCTEISNNYEKLHLKKVGDKLFMMSLWGWMNATDSIERTRVIRGIKNIMDVGTVVMYNEKTNMSVWGDDYCDTFNGTDGTIFHPFFDKNGKDDVVLFNANLCRSISLHCIGKKKFAGLKLLRYTTDLGVDPNVNPKHKCYCANSENCMKKGVYDLQKCMQAPLFISNPHFYLADPSYLQQLEGLSPDKDKHMIILDIDPFAGAPIHVNSRIQFNMVIQKLDKIKLMKNFPNALLPLFWIDEILDLPDFLFKEIKTSHTLITLTKTFLYMMMFSGISMCGYAGFLRYKSTATEEQKSAKPASSNNQKIFQKNLTRSADQDTTLPPVE